MTPPTPNDTPPQLDNKGCNEDEQRGDKQRQWKLAVMKIGPNDVMHLVSFFPFIFLKLDLFLF